MTLTNADLAMMQGQLNTLLPTTCNILSLTRTSDGQGGWTEAWGTATASVTCRLETMRQSGKEPVIADSARPFHSWILTVPYDTSISTASRVEIGSNTYNVKGVDSGKSWNASLRCQLEAV